MPQKINASWKAMLGINNAGQIHKQWLHTLGNLTITGYNPELSNKCFQEKKLIYKNSNVSLNKYFQNIETWNEVQVQKRAEYLADMAVKVWSR